MLDVSCYYRKYAHCSPILYNVLSLINCQKNMPTTQHNTEQIITSKRWIMIPLSTLTNSLYKGTILSNDLHGDQH